MASHSSLPCALALMLLAGFAAGDMYLHNPPGANDRNRERNDNRNNENRIYDSQNNAKGGYPWRGEASANGVPDPITYYVGSKLRLEWTNQHSCGPSDKYVNQASNLYPRGADALNRANAQCDVILQYGCDDGTSYSAPASFENGKFDWINNMRGLRDGYPTGEEETSDGANDGYTKRAFDTGQPCDQGNAQNDDGTETIPADCYTDAANIQKRYNFYALGQEKGVQYGMHEDIEYYNMCRNSQRNKGLYTSDQIVGNQATKTRQNPNGNRHGLECAEERDYYPWWKPSPWRDIAYLTHDTDKCEFIQQQSQNVQSKNFCACDQTCRNQSPDKLAAVREEDCTQANRGTWVTVPAFNVPAPDCRYHAMSRDNHLGNMIEVNQENPMTPAQPNAVEPETAAYWWTIPDDMADKTCVVRIRYNMSTTDFPNMDVFTSGGLESGFTAAKNCPNVKLTDSNEGDGGDDNSNVDNAPGVTMSNPQCLTQLTISSRPLYNRPYVSVIPGSTISLSLAINTHQTGRTFQDRSYVFKVAHAPRDASGTIWNLNVRGRRGNIVQCYPAVEYDFVPTKLSVDDDDLIHIQLHGSDFNAAKNANNGEGWQFSDRSNVVETGGPGLNYPLFEGEMRMIGAATTRRAFALLDQPENICDKTIRSGSNNEQNSINNCGKLNRAPNRFPDDPADGLVRLDAGTYYYMSTRNNNFSNRSQKGQIQVAATSDGKLSPVEIAGIVIGCLAGTVVIAGGVLFFGYKHPNTAPGRAYAKVNGMFMRKAAAPAPDMVYTRH